jgi:hypothetical protein
LKGHLAGGFFLQHEIIRNLQKVRHGDYWAKKGLLRWISLKFGTVKLLHSRPGEAGKTMHSEFIINF